MKSNELAELVARALDGDGSGWEWVSQTKEGKIGAVQFLAVILWVVGGGESDGARDLRIVAGWAERLAVATLRRCATLGGRGPTREITPRDPVTLLELPSVTDDWDWVLAVEDADSFLQRAGMGFLCSDVLAYWRGEPSIYDKTQGADRVGKGNASSVTWTPERLDELRTYRAEHGTKAAAEKFGVSGARVRALLPGKKSEQGGYSAFTHRPK